MVAYFGKIPITDPGKLMKRKVLADKESNRIEIAIRMLQLRARTQTIMAATGMSEDQVRRLYREHCRGQVADRQRGRSPSSTASYLRTLPLRYETAALSGVLLTYGLLKGKRPKAWLADPLQYAEQFCHAYAEYLQLALHEPLGFERAWYFARNLAVLIDVSLKHCVQCGGHHVQDDTDVRRQPCPICKIREQRAALSRRTGAA
jgi:hypothetical protein